ncbi:MAG: CRISPR system precrRNA processing endoribonuclease RAMP protein Cas6 [Syntrophobacteraceae bacterium]|nr:CRISPR system precrRNA processing endoribonuclease RAMP protein Cas6 [Syntrophobacteraceae bacterium]
MFSHISAGRFVLRLKALEEIHLPAYEGSTLRGGFGHALKGVCCALKRQECSSCMLRDRCVYLYLFETPPPPDTEMMRLYPSAPHPFVIEPPLNGRRVIAAGEPFEFGLVVIGRALDYFPYFVYAFMRLGEMGLGGGRRDGAAGTARGGKFSLEDVCAMSAVGLVSIYDSGGQSLKRPAPWPDQGAIGARCETFGATRRVTVCFRTPTRIKSDGRLTDGPEFHHLTRSLLRRLSALSYFHCAKRLELDFKGLIERAGSIERVSSELKWHDWERYSGRQKQRMTLGGFVGEATFAGDFGDFLPMLAWGEVVHVGKAASFGLGRYMLGQD